MGDRSEAPWMLDNRRSLFGLSSPRRPRAPQCRPLDPTSSRALSLVTICLLWALPHYPNVSLVVLRLVRCEELVLLSSRSGARSLPRLCRHPNAIRPPCQEPSFLPTSTYVVLFKYVNVRAAAAL